MKISLVFLSLGVVLPAWKSDISWLFFQRKGLQQWNWDIRDRINAGFGVAAQTLMALRIFYSLNYSVLGRNSKGGCTGFVCSGIKTFRVVLARKTQ